MVNATVSLAKALGGTGITVNTVSPGPIVTPAAERVFRDIAKQRNWGDDWAQIERLAVESFVPNPLGRMGTPEEVAVAVAFLASPLASYIHGTNLRVDGGYITAIN
jgi:3-oxoacyl-[acyl-carrier protein] reductase